MICLHISRLISSILHRAKPETEMERSGIEVHVGVAKPETKMERSGIEVHVGVAKPETDA